MSARNTMFSLMVFGWLTGAAVPFANAEPLKPEVFSGHYQFFEAEFQGKPASAGDVQIEEIQIEVEKSSNTLFMTVLESRDSNQVGTDFLPPFLEINGSPASTKTPTDGGCRVQSELSKTDEKSVTRVARIDDRWLCTFRTKRIEETTVITTSKRSAEMIEITRKDSLGKDELYRFVLLK